MAIKNKQTQSTTAAILQRLEEFLHSKGDNLTRLTSAIGVSRAYFTTVRKVDSEIGSDKIVKILLLYPDLSADWLLTGQGMMLKGATSLKNQESQIAKDKALQIALEGLDKVQEHLAAVQSSISKSKPK